MAWSYYPKRAFSLKPNRFFGELLTALLALAWLILAIWLATTLSPPPHGCIKPTAMPATWFGECSETHHSLTGRQPPPVEITHASSSSEGRDAAYGGAGATEIRHAPVPSLDR